MVTEKLLPTVKVCFLGAPFLFDCVSGQIDLRRTVGNSIYRREIK